MKRLFLSCLLCLSLVISDAQERVARPATTPGAAVPVNTTRSATASANSAKSNGDFFIETQLPATAVKNQAQTGTCWSFSTTSLIESQALKNNLGEYDLSEWFTVRNIYIEKAKNFILRQGNTQFSEGGLGHDQIRAVANYGAVPESVYNGLSPDMNTHNHAAFVKDLKNYLDSVLKKRPVAAGWLKGYTAMLDKMMGIPPTSFIYNNKKYSPETFASEELKFDAKDYVNITSFTHHPYYSSFVLEVPDNFSSGIYYNLPLNEMMELVNVSLRNGYTIMWDADVSNPGFKQKKGLAMNVESLTGDISTGTLEKPWNAEIRQRLFEDLTTQDDHLMHIVGIEKSREGKLFYNVKNSWGDVGPYGGYIKVSEAYFAINTISLVIPKAALSKVLITRLKL